MLSGKPLDPPFTGSGLRKGVEFYSFIDAPLWFTYIVSSGPECLSMRDGGRGVRTVKTVCMSIVFCKESDRVGT